MKKVNLLFLLLYFVGLGLAVAVFFVFVPEVDRTCIAWLNFCIGLLIYTGFLGRLAFLFRTPGKFSDHVPVFAAYWTWWGTYVLITVSAMVIFSIMSVSFDKQILLQGIILFLFLNVVAFGIWGAAWMTRSSAKDKQAIGGVRNIQQLGSALRIAASELPLSYVACKSDIEKLLTEINCMIGSGSEEAIALEGRIAALLTQVSHEIILGISEEELTKKIKELRMVVAMRKNI